MRILLFQQHFHRLGRSPDLEVPVSTRVLGWSVLGQDNQSPSLVLVKLRRDMNNASCCCDMNEIIKEA